MSSYDLKSSVIHNADTFDPISVPASPPDPLEHFQDELREHHWDTPYNKSDRFVSLISWTGSTCKRCEDSPFRVRNRRLPLEEHRTSKSTSETILGERCSVEVTTLKTNRGAAEHGASVASEASEAVSASSEITEAPRLLKL